jgi:catechol-2,3-dioxygenase
MEPKFAVITLWAEDIIMAAHFYHEVLQLELLSHQEGMLHFDVSGVYLVILKGRRLLTQNSESPRFPLFAISVNDLNERVDWLERYGVALPWGIETNKTSRWVMFHDPAGNLIELVQLDEDQKIKTAH